MRKNHIIMPNFVAIGRTTVKIWRLKNDISKWRSSATLISCTRVWTTHEEYLLIFTSPWEGVKYCDQRVCVSLSVSLSVRSHISKTTVQISRYFLYLLPVTVAL